MNKLFRTMRGFLRRDGAGVAEETYLNEATTLVDLEFRQRQIDRGDFRARRHFGY